MKFTLKGWIQKNIMASRQKMLFPLFFLCTSWVAVAQVHPCVTPCDRRIVDIAPAYQHVEVKGDVTVVLSNGPAGMLLLEGNTRDLDVVKTTLKNGSLLINAAKKRSYDKLTVHIPVADIMSLIVNGDAEIFSSGLIKTRELDIHLNGLSFVALNYEGKVKVTAGSGYDLVDSKGINH